MKTVIVTLLLSFVIILSSIQLSAQSDRHPLPDSETFENIPSGRYIRLANGHVYRSLGSGMINVQYNSINRDAYIREGGRLIQGEPHTYTFPDEDNFEHVPAGNRLTLANGYSYTSLGYTQPINVRYNAHNELANVRQGNTITVVGLGIGRLQNHNLSGRPPQ